MELSLVLSKCVNNTNIDGYYGSQKAWFTRNQIGRALEYADPQKAIDTIHARHKERLDMFSVPLGLRATDGKTYDTIMYNIRGVFEICRWSRQSNANMVMDSLYDMAEQVMQKGYYSSMTDQELYEQLGKRLNGQQELVLREYVPVEPRSSVVSAIPLSWVTEKTVTKRRQ